MKTSPDSGNGVRLNLKIEVPEATSISEAIAALLGPDKKHFVLPSEEVKVSGIVWRTGSGAMQG